MAQVIPILTGAGQIGQVGALAIAYIEEVGQHRHRVTLLTAAQQLCHRHLQVLAEQVEQRGLNRGDDVVQAQVDLVRLAQHGGLGFGGHLVSGRLRGAGGVAGDGAAQAVERAVVEADRLVDDQRPAALQRLADAFATRYLPMPVLPASSVQHQVAGEVGACAPQRLSNMLSWPATE